MLHTDIPTQQEIRLLSTRRSDACISIYVPTTPLTQDIGGSRIELGNLSKQALAQLDDAKFDKRRLLMIGEQIDDLLDDDEFWKFQAHSLAVLVTPDDIHTFRLANRLHASVEVSDRFHLKPLLRAVTFPHAAFVLALSENSVRLIQVFADLPPQVVQVPGMPKDAASAVGKSTLNDRSHSRRIHGSEGQKVRLTQYARIVDAAIRPLLAGLDTPFILAASDPLAAIYRSVNAHAALLPGGIADTDDRTTAADIAAAARLVLDRHNADAIREIKQLFELRASAGRTRTDAADIAKSATFGAIDTLLVDIDAEVSGRIDEQTGALSLSGVQDAHNYDVLGEIAVRALNSGARVLAVRQDDIPGGGQLAAILRFGG